MASTSSPANEVLTSKNSGDMPVLREILNELRESAPPSVQPSNSDSTNEDFLINQVILLPQISETLEAIEETNSFANTDVSNKNRSDTLVEALTSSSKRISLLLNSPIPAEHEGQSSNASTIDQTSIQQVDDTQACAAPVPSQIQSSPEPTQKRQHIMISYNRSCEAVCREIRKNLIKSKYIVWMDVYDMHDNFIDGMAKAIGNSYIVLMCVNSGYNKSFWCKKEAEDIAIKQIKFIPLLMEASFKAEGWLTFLMGANVHIDFAGSNPFEVSMNELITEINSVENILATNPRETPPVTPIINTLNTNTTFLPVPLIPSNPNMATSAHFDNIVRNFKTWVEMNRDDLKRFNRKESAQLISQLVQGLENDTNTPNDESKKELLQQLLRATSQDQNDILPRFIINLTTSQYPMIKGLLFIMALWAVKCVFKKN